MNIANEEQISKPKNRKRNMFKLLAEAGIFVGSIISIIAVLCYLAILEVLFRPNGNPAYANIIIVTLIGINVISMIALMYAAETSMYQIKKLFVMLRDNSREVENSTFLLFYRKMDKWIAERKGHYFGIRK